MSIQTHKEEGQRLLNIFESYTISTKDVFVDKLKQWVKKNENEDLDIVVDYKFDDIMAYVNIDSLFKAKIESIRIGSGLLDKYKDNRGMLAAAFLIQLDTYKEFKNKDLILYLFYLGISYSDTKGLVALLSSAVIMAYVKSKILHYLGIALAITISLQVILLFYTWYKFTNSEYKLNIKYGLLNETVDYYKMHKNLMYKRNSISEVKSEKLVRFVSSTINKQYSGKDKACKFLSSYIDSTKDPLEIEKSYSVFKNLCKASEDENTVNTAIDSIKQDVEEIKSALQLEF